MIPNTDKQTHLVHLFPLPNLLLNPGGKITLNIFEPRYLNLISSCERDNVPMAIAHAQTHNDSEGKELLAIPHEKFPFIHPEVGFGRVQVLAQTDTGTKVVVVSGDHKGRVTQVHHGSGGFLSVEVEEVPLEQDLEQEMTFLYRRLRSITRDKIKELLKSDREVGVLMDNLQSPHELLAFYTDHVCRDFSVRMKVFEANNINEKLQIIGKSLVQKSFH